MCRSLKECFRAFKGARGADFFLHIWLCYYSINEPTVINIVRCQIVEPSTRTPGWVRNQGKHGPVIFLLQEWLNRTMPPSRNMSLNQTLIFLDSLHHQTLDSIVAAWKKSLIHTTHLQVPWRCLAMLKPHIRSVAIRGWGENTSSSNKVLQFLKI